MMPENRPGNYRNKTDFYRIGMSMTYEDARDEFRVSRSRVYRCGDRTCGGWDCASCYGEAAALEYIANEEESEETQQNQMTPEEIQQSMLALVRNLSAQVSDNYASVRCEVNVNPSGHRIEWACYSPVYGWTSGTTLDAAMSDQGNKTARRAELLAKAKEMMDLAATLETQPATA